MLYYALIFLVIALVAGALGFTGIAGASAGIAQISVLCFPRAPDHFASGRSFQACMNFAGHSDAAAACRTRKPPAARNWKLA